MAETGLYITHQWTAFFRVGKDPVEQHQNMTGNKDHEDRGQDRYGFLDPTDVEDDQDHGQGTGNRHLVMVESFGNITEDGIAAGGDGDGDGHHVVHQQGAPRDYPGLFAQHMGG